MHHHREETLCGEISPSTGARRLITLDGQVVYLDWFDTIVGKKGILRVEVSFEETGGVYPGQTYMYVHETYRIGGLASVGDAFEVAAVQDGVVYFWGAGSGPGLRDRLEIVADPAYYVLVHDRPVG